MMALVMLWNSIMKRSAVKWPVMTNMESHRRRNGLGKSLILSDIHSLAEEG